MKQLTSLASWVFTYKEFIIEVFYNTLSPISSLLRIQLRVKRIIMPYNLIFVRTLYALQISLFNISTANCVPKAIMALWNHHLTILNQINL